MKRARISQYDGGQVHHIRNLMMCQTVGDLNRLRDLSFYVSSQFVQQLAVLSQEAGHIAVVCAEIISDDVSVISHQESHLHRRLLL